MDNKVEGALSQEDSRKFVGITSDGFKVFLDDRDSHVATHLKDSPELFPLIQEAVSRFKASDIALGGMLNFDIDMGRVVGKSDLVKTVDGDDVFYAKRPNRDIYTRFVRGRDPEPTTFVTMRVDKKEDGTCEVFTAFIGRVTPPFPSGKGDLDDSRRRFWNTHALVAGRQEFLEETVTTECPW